MNEQSAQAIVTIASIAAMADGAHDAQERQQIADVATQLGVRHDEIVLSDTDSAPMAAAQVARRLDSDEARSAAYQVALAVCTADGYANTKETMFLRSLAQSLGVDAQQYDTENVHAARAIDAWLAASAGGAVGGVAGGAAAFSASSGAPSAAFTAGTASGGRASPADKSLDDFILDQAMLSAALELLPDRIANLGILPLQLRLVHMVGQRSGTAVDGVQVKELLATLGIGVAAQVMERVVRRTLGGLAGGLLGGLFGGAAGMAAGGAVTFATTYALGHAAQQYYAQGRSMSSGDMKALFERLKADGNSVYPRVQSRIGEIARGNSFQSIMESVRGELA